MKKITSTIFLLIFIISASAQQTDIFPGLTGKHLRDSLAFYYKPLTVLQYDTARDTLYARIDIHKGRVECIYTGDNIPINPDSSLNPRTQASNQGYSTEHAYPQSMGASTGNPNSNLHHLLPVRQDVNSSRSNLPFQDVPDSIVSRWWRHDYSQTTIPDSLKEEYSKRSSKAFEVRDKSKGNAARAVFYFFTMYQNEAEMAAPDFFNSQLRFIRRWHNLDPPDTLEYVRNLRTAAYQNWMPNPFILDTTLVIRAYGINPPLDFIAEMQSQTQIKLKWVKNHEQDKVLIVRNTSGLIYDPADGEIFFDATNNLNGFVYVSDGDSLIDILPQPGAWYYRIYSYTDTATFSVGLLRSVITGFSDALYYWNFNNNIPEYGQQWGNNMTSVSGTGLLTHTFADVQSFQGTILNTQAGDVAGGSFSAKGMENNDSCLVLHMPTTGFKEIVFNYSTRATSTGYNRQTLFYSTDGITFDSLVSFAGNDFDWQVRTVDFTNIANVSNNPDFKIKIVIRGASSTLGNNRFDNFRLTGLDLLHNTNNQNSTAQYKVYPNPVNDVLFFETPQETPSYFEIRNMAGLLVHNFTGLLPRNLHTVDVSNWPSGMYVCKIVSEKGQRVIKIIVLH